MAEATLTSPFTLDPRQATKLRVREFTGALAYAQDGTLTADSFVRAVIDYVDTNGTIVHTDRFKLTGTQIRTWLANQQDPILTRYMATVGLTGTIA